MHSIDWSIVSCLYVIELSFHVTILKTLSCQVQNLRFKKTFMASTGKFPLQLSMHDHNEVPDTKLIYQEQVPYRVLHCCVVHVLVFWMFWNLKDVWNTSPTQIFRFRACFFHDHCLQCHKKTCHSQQFQWNIWRLCHYKWRTPCILENVCLYWCVICS